MLRDRRVGLLLVASAGFVSLLGAAPQTTLNPLVTRNPRAVTAVPAECEQGLTAAPTPRIELAQIPLPEARAIEAKAPPSNALRTALHEAQDALTRNDRPAFDENRTRARALLAAYPAGEERRVAEDVSRLHETAARLWDAQYESPFFGTESTEYTLVSRLPGYQEAVRRSTLTDDDDRRFYPAAESREFVARAAAERLRRLGIRSTAPAPRVARAEPRSVSRETVRPSSARAPRPRVTQTQTRRSTASTSSTPRRTTPRRTPTSTAAATHTTTRKPAAVTPVPRSPNPSVPPTTAAVPAPAAPHGTTPPAAGGLPTPAPTATATNTTTTTPANTATTATVADTAFDTPPTATTAAETTSASTTTPDTTAITSDTTDTTPIPAPPPATRGRSVILPVILILIGLGVLIVLFRASK